MTSAMRAKVAMLGALLSLGALLLLGCGGTEVDPAPAHTEETDRQDDTIVVEAPTVEAPLAEAAPADPLLVADDFLFEWARGSGPVLVDRVSLRGDGQLIWIRAPRGETRARALETRASDEEVRAVRVAIANARYFELAPRYADPGIQDGSQLTMRVRAAGRSHRVDCDNRFPDEIAGVRSAVEALFTDARIAALASAPEARPEDFDPSLLAD